MPTLVSQIRLLVLYFLPGFIPLALLAVAPLIPPLEVPALLPFLCIELLVTVPFMLWVLRRYTDFSWKKIIARQHHVSGFKAVPIVIGSLGWAASVFTLLGPLGSKLKEWLFHFWPSWLSLDSWLVHASTYPFDTLWIVWSLLIPASIILPIAEEVYFRGYLMNQTTWKGRTSVLLHTLLFAVYHFWSPWLIPIRVLAILPLFYFVHKTRNIYLGMIVHVLLNLVGDVILTFPLVSELA